MKKYKIINNNAIKKQELVMFNKFTKKYDITVVVKDYIYPDGLPNNESKYYLVEDDNKYTILQDFNTPISSSWNFIHPAGLVNGKSNYYLARNISISKKKEAIFHKNHPGVLITNWYDQIYINGLIKNNSCYYIAINQCKKAIFDLENKKDPISDWWPAVYSNGLVNGISDYYIAENDNYERAIFHKNNKKEPIVPFKDKLSNYYIHKYKVY